MFVYTVVSIVLFIPGGYAADTHADDGGDHIQESAVVSLELNSLALCIIITEHLYFNVISKWKKKFNFGPIISRGSNKNGNVVGAVSKSSLGRRCAQRRSPLCATRMLV